MKRYLKKVIFCTADLPWEIRDGEQGILYIADNEQTLRLLKSRNLPVAAWLHEGNRGQNLSAAAYAVEKPEELDMDFYEKVYRRERNIPWDILETDRCLVREMIPEDGADFAEMYRNPEISRYMKDFHDDAEGEAKYISEYQQQYRFCEYGVWSVVLKETGQVVGRAGFSDVEARMGTAFITAVESNFKAGKSPGAEADCGAEKSPMTCTRAESAGIPCLGYMIGVPWQNQGIAYEVCRAILDYAKEELGFEQVQLFVEESNLASLHLSERLGFGEVGRLQDINGCQVIRKMLS